MTRGNRYSRVALMVLTLLWGSMPALSAATPMEEIKKTIGQALAILQDSMDAGDAGRARRREMLRDVLSLRFDFKEMARMSLGAHWNRQPTRQQEFVSAFTGFVENSYVSKMESLKGTEVVYLREHVDRELAQVDTKIVPNRGDDVPVHYKLHLSGGEWKIYDVIVENVSLVDNYRSQFNRVLTSATFDDLLRKLQLRTSARGG